MNASHGVICTVNPQRNPTKLKAYQKNFNNSPVFTKVLLWFDLQHFKDIKETQQWKRELKL